MTEITNPEAKRFLTRQIADWEAGWRNMIGADKGKVTDSGALHAIAVLQWTLKNLPPKGTLKAMMDRRKPKKRK